MTHLAQLEQQLVNAALRLQLGQTRAERQAAFADMRRLKAELARDTADVARKEQRLGLIP